MARAGGYEKRGDNYINTPYLDMSIPYAAGSLYATIEDSFLWDKVFFTYKILSKKIYRFIIYATHSNFWRSLCLWMVCSQVPR